MLPWLVIAFLPSRRCLLISWLQSPSTVILEPKKIKSVTVSIFFPFYLQWSDETVAIILSFWMLSFKVSLFTPSFTFIKRLFSSSSLSTIRVVSSAYLKLLIRRVTIPSYLLMCSFPNFKPAHCSTSGSNCTSWAAYSFLILALITPGTIQKGKKIADADF